MEHRARVFLSYVSEDGEAVSRLEGALEARGLPTWLDRTRLRPGERWTDAVRHAIRAAPGFVACFSPAFAARETTCMLLELELACEELRRRRRERSWLVPVLLGEAEVPALPIDGATTLRDLCPVALHGDWEAGVGRLVAALRPAARGPLVSSATRHRVRATGARMNAHADGRPDTEAID